jgi:hypothetical protein
MVKRASGESSAKFARRDWCSLRCKAKKLTVFGVEMTVRELADMLGKSAAYVEASMRRPGGMICRLIDTVNDRLDDDPLARDLTP